MSVVELRKIVKQYPKVRALDEADFTLEKGEIHALLGENGAGKSTLMKVLYGMTKPDSGQIIIRGEKVRIKDPLQAINLGIGMVHQHFMLADVMTVLENIIIGEEVTKYGYIDRRACEKKVCDMIERFKFNLDSHKKIEDLSVGEKQRVEILKVLYRGVDILILDEPTAVLTPLEVSELFKVLRQLKEEGKSIIIITHKLHEVLEIADRITVMRDGIVTGYADPKNVTENELAHLMVGRNVDIGKKEGTTCIGEPRLKVCDVILKDKERTLLDQVNLTLRTGEIYGIAGVEGNGQSELVEVLVGLQKATEGHIYLNDKVLEGDVCDFIQAGIGHVPEDRLVSAVVEDMTIADNCILGYHDQPRYKKKFFYNHSVIRDFAEKAIEKYKIKAPSSQVMIHELSGGNQQKVVIARVFEQSPQVVICSQPTRGVDVGAIEYIHQKMREFRDAGNTILLLSADLEEIKSLSDRIGVIYKGKIVGEKESFTDTEFGILMTGGTLKDE